MTNGVPDLKGSILIDTGTVKQAVKTVSGLGSALKKMADDSNTSSKAIEIDIKKQQNLYKQLAQEVRMSEDGYQKVSDAQRKMQIILAKMGNTFENFSASVKKSNLSQQQQAQIISTVGARLKGFEAALKDGADSGLELQSITTQFSNAMAKAKREVSATSAAINQYNKEQQKAEQDAKKNEAVTIKTMTALAALEDKYNELTISVNASTMADAKKLELTNKLKTKFDEATSAIKEHGVSSTQAAQASIGFNRSTKEASGELKKFGNARKSADMSQAATDFRNLTSSVVVALGPLSGVAARMTALQGIFDRNAISVGAFLAAMTGFSVLFAKSVSVAQTAEQQMLRLEAQLNVLGSSAQLTGQEINEMAHRLAAATLLSAEQVRLAAGALLEFGGIGREQFAKVITAAQGMSVILGGDLKENVRKLGRVLENPARNMDTLRESLGEIDGEVRRQVISLQQQGRQQEAVNLLLSQFEQIAAGARGEAQGLSGAYDTVAGNLDKLFEDLMNNSGALKSITDNINIAAKAIADFGKTDEALILSASFKEIADIGGTAIKFLIDNIRTLTNVFVFIGSMAVPLVIKSLLSFANAATMGLIPALLNGTVALKAFRVETVKSVITTQLLTKSVGGVVFGLLSIGAVMVTYNAAMRKADEIMEKVTKSSDVFGASMIKTGNLMIAQNERLTKSQADYLRQQLTDAQTTGESLQQQIDENKKAYLDASEELTTELEKQSKLRAQITQKESDLSRLTTFGFGKSQWAEDYRKELQGLNRDLRTSVTVSDGLKNQLAPLREEGGRLNREFMRLSSSTRDVIQGIESFDVAIADAAEKERQHKQTLSDLLKSYDQNAQKLENLKNIMKAATDAHEYFTSQGDKGKESAKQLARIISELSSELHGLQFTEAEKGARKFTDALNDAKNKLSDMQEVFKSKGESSLVELNRSLQDTRLELDRLDPAVLAELGKSLGETNPEKIKAAYIQQLKTIGLQVIKQEELNESQQDLLDILEEQKPKFGATIEKFKEMQEAATTPEEKAGLAKWLKTEIFDVEQLAKETIKTPFSDLTTIEEEYEERRRVLLSLYSQDILDQKGYLEKLQQQMNQSKFFLGFTQAASEASAVVSGAMELMTTANRENSKDAKKIAIANALIAQSMAVANIWAGVGGIESVPAKIALSALAAAQVGAQVAAIRKQKFASGGYVSGPGTGRSDSISAMLSNGEFVMSAAAVRKLGVSNLEKMNKGQMPMFNTGGLIGTTSPGTFSSSTNVQIIDQSTGSKDFIVEESTNQFGQSQIKVLIKNAVKEGIVRGDFNREMAASFGLQQKGRSL